MTDSRRTLLVFVLAVARKLLTAEQAVQALSSIQTMSPRAAGAAGGPAAALGRHWDALGESQRQGFLKELEVLENDLPQAEGLVVRSEIPEKVRRAWWGDTSQGLPADWAIDPDFEIGDEMGSVVLPSTSTKGPVLPRLAPEERYAVQREVARGGMGRILLVKDVLMGRNVAMKEVLNDAGDGSTSDEVERFLREARITGQLEHPNIVPVHEVGQRPDGTFFYTMKMVRGETMAKRLGTIMNDERLSNAKKLEKRLKLLDAFVDVCQAVAYAHARGVLNRDLKPSNVMLGDYGETVLLDWGLARVAGRQDVVRKPDDGHVTLVSAGTSAGSAIKLTMDGAIMGTPAYMSPEQARGDIETVDERSDVYSLGAILFEIVTGVPPFTGPSAIDVVRKVAVAEPPSASSMEKGAPRELEVLIRKAMAREQKDRLPSAKLLAEEVNAFRDGRALATYSYTGLQQASRWVRRHKGLSVGAAAAIVAMVAGTIVSTKFAKRAQEEAVSARTAETRANVAADKAALRAKDAEAAAQRAEGLRLAAKSRVQVAKNPGQALWLAMRGAERAPVAESNSAIYAALASLNETRRMYGTEGYVNVATFSPDGTRVASGGMDHAVRLWDAKSGAELARFDGHTRQIRLVDFSPDGATLLSSAEDGTVRLWSVANGSLVGALRGHGRLPGAAWGAGGRFVATWGPETAPRLWTADGRPVCALGEAQGSAAEVSVSPDGRLAAVALWSGACELRSAADGSLAASLPHPKGMTGARWTPDGREVVTAGLDGVLRRWDAGARALVRATDVEPGHPLQYLRLTEDGSRAAVIAEPKNDLVMVALDDGSLTRRGFAEPLNPRALSPDGKQVLRRSQTDIQILDTGSETVLQTLRGHSYGVIWLEFSRDGRFVASASNDTTVGVWSVARAPEMPLFEWSYRRVHLDPEFRVRVLDFDLSRGHALVWLPESRTLELADVRTGSPVRTILKDVDAPQQANFIDDRTILDVRPEPLEFRFIDASTGAVRHVLPHRPEKYHHCSINGSFVVARFGWEPDGFWRVWDSRTGETVGDVPIDRMPHGFDVSPDGTRLLAANREFGCGSVYDVGTGKLLHRLEGHTGFVLEAAVLGDGRRGITTCMDASAKVWELATGKEVAQCRWPRIEELRLAPSPDGSRVWIMSRSEARLFETATGQLLGQVDEPGNARSGSWSDDQSIAVLHLGSGNFRFLPTDPIAAGKRALPRMLAPFELAELEIGVGAERQELVAEWKRRHPMASSESGLGESLLKGRRSAEAVEAFRRSLAIYPRHVPGAYGLARALTTQAALPESSAIRERLVDEALAAVRKALELGLDPEALKDPGLDALRGDARWPQVESTKPAD